MQHAPCCRAWPLGFVRHVALKHRKRSPDATRCRGCACKVPAVWLLPLCVANQAALCVPCCRVLLGRLYKRSAPPRCSAVCQPGTTACTSNFKKVCTPVCDGACPQRSCPPGAAAPVTSALQLPRMVAAAEELTWMAVILRAADEVRPPLELNGDRLRRQQFPCRGRCSSQRAGAA